MVLALILIAILAVSAVIVFVLKNGKQSFDSNGEDFQDRIRPYCSREEFIEFFDYLQNRKKKFIGPEKGKLKGIFFRLIVPNSNISVQEKEDFRWFLINIGVRDVDSRPDYETRDTKLKNRNTDADEFKRKEAGNNGEQVVRDVLKLLDSKKYSVINGPALKFNDTVHEFDHIVVGDTGIFIIETKAFGMTDGKSCKAGLFIDPGDKWIIRKNQKNRELESPTAQVLEEVSHLENVIHMPGVKIFPVLALSNAEIFVKQNIELPYAVVKADELVKYITSREYYLNAQFYGDVLTRIDRSRIN